ncbi:hypothetical protein [Pseudomonas indica]|uniref:hypothetical protein n=1 Tax=Pseudomonas indica TaxID=137658 RepID=UPI0011132E95|nr:hypothetical protein [Pseudomonas indica]
MSVSSVGESFEYVQLALASYALFGEGLSLSQAIIRTENFSKVQAADFQEKYRLVDHSPNDVFGFSATVFWIRRR